MDALILMLLFVGSLASQTAYSQDVDIRGTSDKVSADGGGQSRTIYSQRHLSPHRMMHFGKRPSLFEPPTIMTPSRVYELYQQRHSQPMLASQQQQQLQLLPDRYLELERGQNLQPVLEELLGGRDMIYVLDRPQLEFAINSAGQQAANPLAGQRFLKLVSSETSADGNGDSNEKNAADAGTELASAERAQQSSSQDGQQQAAISVSTRSMQTGRANTLNIPKAYISSLLYGRQGASSFPSFGSYNKKAEPKDNFFMHFGRK